MLRSPFFSFMISLLVAVFATGAASAGAGAPGLKTYPLCKSVNLRIQKVGFVCVTSVGVRYILAGILETSQYWMGPDGQAMMNVIGAADWESAHAYCEGQGARLPTIQDMKMGEANRFDEVLQSMTKEQSFWLEDTRTVQEKAFYYDNDGVRRPVVGPYGNQVMDTSYIHNYYVPNYGPRGKGEVFANAEGDVHQVRCIGKLNIVLEGGQ